MKANFYTTQGPTRPANQDGVYLEGQSFTDTPEPLSLYFPPGDGMFAVVDGMGGPSGGELATEIILGGLGIFAGQSGACEALEAGARQIQSLVRSKSSIHPRMGAALAGIWVNRSANLVFNCGDCRAYRSRSGFLEKISHDHSVVQELIDAGRITEDEARYHPRKNLLTSAISAEDPDPQIYCREIDIKSGDQFLLCSDGLWECLSLEEMEEIMANPPDAAAMDLKKAIWEKGARDNASFIIMTFD